MENGKAQREPMPLSGITVLDLGQVYLGPYASFLMAMAGAEVIKIEPPGGETARRRAEVSLGASLPFEMLNVNKSGITLNLKTETGRALFLELVEDADVVLENFSPGVMDRLGVGWEVLRRINPRLIYASATGFGLTGPDRENLAMDLTIQAVSGIMATTGSPGGPPVKAGPAVADFLCGTHLYAGVLTALFDRLRTGKGCLVEVAMLDTMYCTLASSLGLVYEHGDRAQTRVGNRHSGLSLAPYNVYATRDGHVAIICTQEVHWQRLLVAMGREDLRDDPRFATHADRVKHLEETDAVVQAWTGTSTRADVFQAAKRHRLLTAPVRDVFELMHDPHLHARGMLQWSDHPRLGQVVLPNSPLRLHGAATPPLAAAPALGSSNQQIFGRLGRSAEEIGGLQRQGVI